MPRKVKPIPIPQLANPKERFDRVLETLLAVKKTELQDIEKKLEDVRREKTKRKRLSKGN